MKKWILFLALGGSVLAQTDAPPELEQPFAPDALPPIGAPPLDRHGNLTVVFSGATAFSEAALRQGIVRQIRTIEEFGLDEPNAYDAMFFLDAFYRQHGYAHAEASYAIEGPWKLHLTIKEGPLTHVGEVNFIGNTSFDAATLSEYLLGPIKERFPRIREITRLPFVETDVFSGADLVRRLYISSGYLEAEVDPPEITFDETETSARIELTIREGTAYRFGAINFTGQPGRTRDELMAVIAEQANGPYTEGRLAAAGRALDDYLTKRGHFLASVEPFGDVLASRNGLVPVNFQIEAGPVYRFDGVTVAGTEGVKPSFLKNRLRHLSGTVYNPRALDKTFRELIQTGLFRDVRITPQAIAGDEVRLDVTVEEAKPKEFGIGLGFASFYGGIVSLTYRDLNFLGTARPFSVNLEANQRGFSGEVLYTDPWFLETDYELRLRLYALNERLKGYSKNEVGFRPTISRDITDHWKLSAFVNAKAVATIDVEIEPESLIGEADYTVFSLGLSQTLDYRNNISLPTRGFVLGSSIEVAPNGVGDVSFVRGLANFSYYLPVTAKSTLALGARGGVIAPLSGADLPIGERFFNGGATTVRSFSELTLGPKDDAGYPLGGQGFTIFNIEYTFPLFGDLYGAVFVDAGNVVSEAEDFGFDSMRYAVGAGLRYNLPIGAIRFDYGLNPSPRDGEAQGAFHFAIGVAF